MEKLLRSEVGKLRGEERFHCIRTGLSPARGDRGEGGRPALRSSLPQIWEPGRPSLRGGGTRVSCRWRAHFGAEGGGQARGAPARRWVGAPRGRPPPRPEAEVWGPRLGLLPGRRAPRGEGGRREREASPRSTSTTVKKKK